MIDAEQSKWRAAVQRTVECPDDDGNIECSQAVGWNGHCHYTSITAALCRLGV